MIRIRDWEKHFERDRTKQWKHLQWVPIPNKQGSGYRKIMKLRNGLEIFGCWIALIELGSTCNPRGDLTKYSRDELSDLLLVPVSKINTAVSFLSQTLDWIEVIENLDIHVKNLDSNGMSTCDSSSIQSSSILSSGEILESKIKGFVKPTPDELEAYIKEKNLPVDPVQWWNHYEAKGWMIGKNKMINWRAAVHTWVK